MKTLLTTLLLGFATLTFAQAGFAEEAPAQRYKLVNENHAAMQHYQAVQQAAEQAQR